MQFRLAPHIGVLPPCRAQINALRALALSGVFLVHFGKDDPAAELLRVSLFFVLAGFMITHVLFRTRVRRGPVSPWAFWIRRALRLMPALMLLGLLGWLFDMDGFRQRIWWHILPLSNIAFATSGEVRPLIAGHLWSISLLMQVYLVWALVLLSASLPWLYLTAAIGWVLMVFLRVNAARIGLPEGAVWPILAADPVFLGAMAYLLCQSRRFALAARTAPVQALALLVLALPLGLWEGFGRSESYRLLMQPALAALTIGAFFGYGGPVGRILESRPVQWLGQISYGVFVYHLLIYWAVGEMAPDLAGRAPIVHGLVLLALTMIAAGLSWLLIERPIAGLQRHVPTGGRASGQGAPVPPQEHR